MENANYIASDTRYSHPEFYRRSGNSGILLPKISLGLWKNFGHTTDFLLAQELLHYAFDNGITHFDLANNYGPPPGAAEVLFGQVLKSSFSSYRDELFISTKAGYEMWAGPYGNWGSRKSLISSLDQSLKRMRTDYVDLFYIHRYDPATPLDETLQALVDIVRSGKALYVGISRWPLQATIYGLEYLKKEKVPCLCYQGRLNLLDRSPINEGILSFLQDNNCGFVSFSPLAQGLLAGRYMNGIPSNSRIRKETSLVADTLTDELHHQLLKLKHISEERNETMAQVALNWILHQDGVTSVIVGASTKEQLADSIQSAYCPKLTQEELDVLNKIYI